MSQIIIRRNPTCVATPTLRSTVVPRPVGRTRCGLTLAELLVATTVTAIVIGALGVFTKAVMDGSDEASKTGVATQAGRVVTARVAHEVATSRQVLKVSDALKSMPAMDQVLVVWERDGEPADTAPGQPNWVELVIYAPSKNLPTQLWELRPKVDPALVVPFSDPILLYFWMDRFRSRVDIVQPPIALTNDLGGVHFDVEECNEPQGIGGMIQQNVRTVLCISPQDQEAAVFFGSATRRFTEGN